jgi:hypothetical protein
LQTHFGIIISAFAFVTSQARAGEQAIKPYDYAIGFAPIAEVSESGIGLGVLSDLEIATADLAPIVRVAVQGSTKASAQGERHIDTLERSAGVTLEPGVRYYLTPFSDSWVFAGTAMIDFADERFKLADGKGVRRTWDSIGAHLAGGYRWIWPSGFYVLLATGPLIPIYDRFDEVQSGGSRTRMFWGSWHLAGLSAIGKAF